jgi:hypothetical protein
MGAFNARGEQRTVSLSLRGSFSNLFEATNGTYGSGELQTFLKIRNFQFLV